VYHFFTEKAYQCAKMAQLAGEMGGQTTVRFSKGSVNEFGKISLTPKVFFNLWGFRLLSLAPWHPESQPPKGFGKPSGFAETCKTPLSRRHAECAF